MTKIKYKWINVRSSSFKTFNTKVNDILSKDDTQIDIESLINCPICLNIIFDKNKLFQCPKCFQNICLICKDKIEISNNNFKCPLCRHTIECENKENSNSIQNTILRSNEILSFYI